MYQVLLVEDSLDTQEIVKATLRSTAQVTAVPSIKEGIKAIENKIFDLFLFDVILEDGDGFDLAKQVKSIPNGRDVPLIFVTALDEIESKMQGFKLGAEDYIVKPFNMMELQIRVESRLQKISNQKPRDSVVRGNLRVEVPQQRVFLIDENRNLELTPLQFKILFALLSQENTPITREQLIDDIWGKNIHVGRSIDTHINSLRKKLGEYSYLIQSVYGTGYVFSQKKPVK